MAKIDGIIGAQNFEKVRDRIGEILFVELANQFTMVGNPAWNPTVYVERFTPFMEVDLPAINVKTAVGDYKNKDQIQVDGYYTYLIQVYVASGARAATQQDIDMFPEARWTVGQLIPGDILSTYNISRITGICRAILSNPQYKTLAFAPGNIGRCMIERIIIPRPEEISDAINCTYAQIEFSVRVIEDVELLTPIPLLTMGTVVKLYLTDKGYMYGYGNGEGLFIDEERTAAYNVQYFISENGGDMPVIKFSELEDAPALDATSSFVGIIDNGDGTYQNILYTYGQIAALVSGNNKVRITVETSGDTLTNVFFATNTISEIVTNGQSYLSDVNFTQDGDTITGIDISFYETQVLIAKI
jgi:hypothetical protein